MQEAAEVLVENENEFEVAYNEEYDPEREKELEAQLKSQKGSLSPYWARRVLWR